VADFDVNGGDRLSLQGLGVWSFEQVMARTTQVGADVVIDFGGGDAVTLLNVDRGGLTAGDFILG
jgi:hypothetical protein